MVFPTKHFGFAFDSFCECERWTLAVQYLSESRIFTVSKCELDERRKKKARSRFGPIRISHIYIYSVSMCTDWRTDEMWMGYGMLYMHILKLRVIAAATAAAGGGVECVTFVRRKTVNCDYRTFAVTLYKENELIWETTEFLLNAPCLAQWKDSKIINRKKVIVRPYRSTSNSNSNSRQGKRTVFNECVLAFSLSRFIYIYSLYGVLAMAWIAEQRPRDNTHYTSTCHSHLTLHWVLIFPPIALNIFPGPVFEKRVFPNSCDKNTTKSNTTTNSLFVHLQRNETVCHQIFVRYVVSRSIVACASCFGVLAEKKEKHRERDIEIVSFVCCKNIPQKE